MASLRQVLRPARRAFTEQFTVRPFSTTTALHARVSNAPPVDPPAQVDLGVGEIEGAKFRVEPLRRVGEDEKTMRARLVYQSRKRGTLESDLLLSTFADKYLPTMTKEQMGQYDLFMDENDWDIYYWATQEAPSPVLEGAADSPVHTETSAASYAGGAEAALAESSAAKSTSTWTPTSPFAEGVKDAGQNAAAAAAAASEEPYRKPGEGEWAQTVGTFKPSYRPVPARWRDSEILKLLREHVRRRSKGGEEGGGMGFMPALRNE